MTEAQPQLTPQHKRTKTSNKMAISSTGMILKMDKTEHEKAALEYEETLYAILKSRLLLRKIIEEQMYLDRVKRGGLNPKEICDLLKNQADEDDEDFVLKITDLRRRLMNEIRANAALESEIEATEYKITLLVQNAGEARTNVKSKKYYKQNLNVEVKKNIPNEMLKHYSHFFYLLQSEPLYLARYFNVIAQSGDNTKFMINSIILTLYSDGELKRENYLILTLIKKALELQMSTMTDLWTSIENQSIIPNIVAAYNRRKDGLAYLEENLAGQKKKFLNEFSSKKLDLTLSKILSYVIDNIERATGVISPLRNAPNEKLMENEEIKKEFDKRVEDLKRACDLFFNEIIKSLDKFPYGLRYICKVICKQSVEAFQASESDCRKYIGYFTYYRFISTYIIDTKDGKEMQLLIAVNKILVQLFLQIAPFPDNETYKCYAPINEWINSKIDSVKNFFDELIKVPEPEEKFEIDKYLAMTEDVKPTILITPEEISMFHTEVTSHLQDIAPNTEDPLNKIVKSLGEPVNYTDTTQIALNLIPENVALALEDDEKVVYNKTKTLLLNIFKFVSKQGTVPDTLEEILSLAEKLATQKSNEKVLEDVKNVRNNLVVLEEKKMLTKEDGQNNLLTDVALEIANRAEIREQQQKELATLQNRIQVVQKKQAERREVLESFQEYCQQCVQKQFQPRKPMKKKKGLEGQLFKPKEYSYNDLVKKHVIVSSVIPNTMRKVTKVVISSSEAGVFDVVVKLPGISEKAVIKLEDLLEKRANGNTTISISDQIELDVNMTIFTMNQLVNKR